MVSFHGDECGELYIETYIQICCVHFHKNVVCTITNMIPATMDWELGNVQTSSKGIRSAPLTNADGSHIIVQLTDVHNPLKAPFGSAAYNDPTAIRQNMCF